MTDAERQQLVHDAIILERAIRVLHRRASDRVLAMHVMPYLGLYARGWREEAEDDG